MTPWFQQAAVRKRSRSREIRIHFARAKDEVCMPRIARSSFGGRGQTLYVCASIHRQMIAINTCRAGSKYIQAAGNLALRRVLKLCSWWQVSFYWYMFDGCFSIFLHYYYSVHAQFRNIISKTGLAKTKPAGPLVTAMHLAQ